ncbi:MAG: hypothetical protein N3D09_01885 [Archaeoglobaceae archaeon]|nr:hypothetical protein [Archaeoglobaceae archaeon]
MKLITATIITFALLQSVSAGVLEISDMKVSIYVGEKANFKYNLTIKNLIDKPIVPGISEIRLQKLETAKILVFPLPFGEERRAAKVENLKAYSGNMNFKIYSETHGNYTAIYYEVWYPIEPYGEKDLTIEFEADLVDKGLLFKSISIPFGSDTDIKRLELNFSSDWKLCYLEGDIRSIPANHLAFVTAEFSLLPLPMLPLRGSTLFWGMLILLIFISAIFLVRK